MTDTPVPAAFLDIHVLQTIPLSGLNLDGDGCPKSVVLGGATRGRISAYSKKRPVRLHIEESLPDQASVRTRRLVHEVRDLLIGEEGWSEELATFTALDVFTAATGGRMSLGSSADDIQAKDPLATAALIYTPTTTAHRMAATTARRKHDYEIAFKEAEAGTAKPRSGRTAKKDTEQEARGTVTDPADVRGLLAGANAAIALLGRTLMEIDGAERDACVQVASAFTTHEANIEIDFFVAVDDYAAKTQGVPAVGLIGDQRLVAGTFYMYSTIALRSFADAVNNDHAVARAVCRAYIDGFIHTLPKTGQTSSAAWTLPDLVHLAVRTDRPVNLSTAFDNPITGRQGNAAPSIARLSDYAKTIQRLTAGRGLLHSVHAYTGTTKLPGLGTRVDTFDQATESALDAAFRSTP
ncbi:type I-E CRISPR-associated protein Cas7/Cse4/CasC [Kitasatospora aureofaciens]|uniref:type I-E CRISPR-associated protein Cas7/Cse4/CasC n=1 Tax=Kitasatospora aureofaciens TaxID=1894 RepID=UPI001C452DC3|nr:type I-E CRISPR-associated protein Cas7/Cse4/CasC [Kitasatospora aureofaciens]MBV6695729.1 type I-E CRISPR-associated protein Cas7/Cse4/CasC [Kitasatospora aureofaciens]